MVTRKRVRELTVEEIPKLVQIIKGFECETCFVKVDVEHTISTCLRLISNGQGAVFGLFDRSGEIIGGLGCIKGPELSTGIMMAIETFWFVHPDKRGNGLALFEAFEEWGREQGCGKLAMVHLVDSHPDQLQRYYESEGYTLVELHYVKELRK